MPTKALVAAVVAVGAVAAAAASGAPGDLDGGFGSAGISLRPEGDSGHAAAFALARRDDGRLMLAGFARNAGGNRIMVSQRNADGTADSSFAGGTTLSVLGTGAAAYAVAPHGEKVVVAGRAEIGGTPTFFVARYNANGTIDSSFAGGTVTDAFASTDAEGRAVTVVGSDVIAAGRVLDGGTNKFGLTRRLDSGDPAPGFGTAGRVLTPVGDGGDSGANALIALPDGRLVAAGYATDAGALRLAMVAYKDGAPDPDFGTAGKVITAAGDGGDAGAKAIAQDPTGRIVLAGHARDGAGYKLAVARYGATGAPDGGFGSSGKVVLPVGDGTELAVNGLAAQSDGKVVVTGQASSAGVPQVFVARLNGDGTPDSTFGAAGIVLTPLGDGGLSAGQAVALAGDTAIVAGYATDGGGEKVAMARYLLADPPIAEPPVTEPPVTEPPITDPAADTVAPLFLSASMTNRRFRVGKRRTAITAVTRRIPVGTKFRFSLSEAATVTIRIERPARGVKVGTRCLKPTRTRRGSPCTRYLLDGTLTRRGAKGSNRVAFSGRIGKRALRVGKHRAKLRARDAARNRSKQRVLRFAVVRAKARGADHRDGPVLADTAANGRLDIGDMFAFRSPTNANNTVLAMTASPFSGVVTPTTFVPAAHYEVLVDRDMDGRPDLTWQASITAEGAGQRVLMRCLPTHRCFNHGLQAAGSVGTNLPVLGGGTVRASNFDDPFFFDQGAFDSFVAPGGAFPRSMATAKNFYGANANILGVVLELPSVRLGPTNSLIGVWARTEQGGVQIDREARPTINTMLIPPVPRNNLSRGERRNAFNAGAPITDRPDFTDDMKSVYTGFFGRTAADATAITNLLLPDMLIFQVGNPNGLGTFVTSGTGQGGFGAGTVFGNGRRLRDDVSDILLNIHTNGAKPTDNVPDDNGTRITDGNMGTVPAFPYVGAPNASPSGPNP